MAKFISDPQIIGERGRHLVSERILAVGLSFHPTGALDAGIDGFLELRDLETGEVRAQFVPAQIKTQAEGPFPRETVTSFTYIPKSRDLDYWLQANVPVILIVARLSDGLIVWKSVQEWFAAPEHRVSRSIEFDVRQDALTVEALPALAELVASFARPGLMVPPMRAPEELDLNLLKAVVPERVNIATTDRSYGEITDLLGEGGRRRPVDWILHDEKIITFHDLEAAPFDSVVEEGTAEPIDTLYWAESEEEVTRRQFVDLLRRCLSARMKGLLTFHRRKRILYFRKGERGSIERKLKYQSYEKEATRHVVKAGGKAKSGKGPAYYRHAALLPNFVELRGDWYLAIEPTYHFTHDGSQDYAFEAERLSGIKRLETNQSVRSHIGMWRAILTKGGDLLKADYPYLRFETPDAIPYDYGVPDELWRGGEDDETKKRFAEAQRDLFE